MQIVVLGHNLIGGGGLSVGKNIVSLLPNVAPAHNYSIFVPKGVGYPLHLGRKNVTVTEVPRMTFIERVRFDLFHLPKQVKELHPDVVLALGNLGLQKPPCKQAILFHQPHLIYDSKHYGKTVFSERIRITYLVKWWLAKSLKSTNLVFCQTPVARERFARSFHYPLSRIKIMPNAVSEFAKMDKEAAGTPAIFVKRACFNLFFLTSFNAHKNLEVLIDIFRNHSQVLKGIRCIVTVAPEQHQNAPKFLSDIRKYNLQEHIVNVGHLEQRELAGYFYNSDALLFPTLLESFSGTYLEAMHFGLPILTSDLDFARYTCGDAALYFNPWETTDIVDKILILKNDVSLRQQLIRKGHEHIASFFQSWEDIVADAIKQLELLGDCGQLKKIIR